MIVSILRACERACTAATNCMAGGSLSLTAEVTSFSCPDLAKREFICQRLLVEILCQQTASNQIGASAGKLSLIPLVVKR
jgi:hypothetical protein